MFFLSPSFSIPAQLNFLSIVEGGGLISVSRLLPAVATTVVRGDEECAWLLSATEWPHQLLSAHSTTSPTESVQIDGHFPPELVQLWLLSASVCPHHPKWGPTDSHSPEPPSTSHPHSASEDLPLLGTSSKWLTQHTLFWVCYLSLRLMFSDSIHAVARASQPFLLTEGAWIILFQTHVLFNPSVGGVHFDDPILAAGIVLEAGFVCGKEWCSSESPDL